MIEHKTPTEVTNKYVVTAREPTWILESLGLSTDSLRDKSVIIIGDGINLELTRNVICAHAREVCVIDPTFGLSNDQWIALNARLKTSHTPDPNYLEYLKKDSLSYLPLEIFSQQPWESVSSRNSRRYQHVDGIAPKFTIIPAHLPEDTRYLEDKFGNFDILIDFFAAWYYTYIGRHDLINTYVELLKPNGISFIGPKVSFTYEDLQGLNESVEGIQIMQSGTNGYTIHKES